MRGIITCALAHRSIVYKRLRFEHIKPCSMAAAGEMKLQAVAAALLRAVTAAAGGGRPLKRAAQM